MGVFDDIRKYINRKLEKSESLESNPELLKEFMSWNLRESRYVSKELFVPGDISQERVFKVLDYMAKIHPNIVNRISHINFESNITFIPENAFNGWKIEFVNLSSSPRLTISKNAFANTPNLRYITFFDGEKADDLENAPHLDIQTNAFVNSALQNIIVKTPCTFHMPIINEVGRKEGFKIFLGSPDIGIDGDEEEKYHNVRFDLINERCVENNSLFVMFKKYNYEYEFGQVYSEVKSYFVDEYNIKKMLKNAFDIENKTLTIDDQLADMIEDTKLISSMVLKSKGLTLNSTRENFNKIVFDIVKDNNFVYGDLRKLVYAVNNTDLPSFCLAGNERVKEVEIKGKKIGIDRFALANSSVEKVYGNYVDLGHRAFAGSKITSLEIPSSCTQISTDIIDHQCKIFIDNTLDTKVDSYFVNPNYLANEQPKRITRRHVKRPVLHLKYDSGNYLNESIRKYLRVHKVEAKPAEETVFSDMKSSGRGGR